MTEPQRILIIDFGSQYTQLIARRVREAHVYCEIHPPSRTVEWIREWAPSGIILSGGPNSVYGENVPTADPALLELGTPVLGVCYGMQLLAQLSGGKVERAARRAEQRTGHHESQQHRELDGRTALFPSPHRQARGRPAPQRRR